MAQVAKALEDEDVPDDEPKVGKAPKQKKKESDTAFETRMREYRAQCHQLCVYKTAQLAGTARKRDLLLDLVADYHAEKTRPQHGRIQRLHHRRIPTRHPIPLHRSHLPQTLHARAA